MKKKCSFFFLYFILIIPLFSYETGIEIQTKIPGIKVFIDGIFKGETYYVEISNKNIIRIELPPNTYRAHFDHSDYNFNDVYITVDENGYTIHVLEFSEKNISSEGIKSTGSEAVAKVGTIIIRSNPSQASIELDKKKIKDISDCKISNVRIGKHQIKILFQSQKPLIADIELFPDSLVTITADFIKGNIFYDIIFNINNGNEIKMVPVYNSLKINSSTINNLNSKTDINEFYISKYEITQDFYTKIMNNNPSEYGKDQNKGQYPVEGLSWTDAIRFCNTLSELEGLESVYEIGFLGGNPDYCNFNTFSANFKKNGYRLPTEIEWEFAANGGIYSKGYRYPGSNTLSEIAWWNGNSEKSTHVVGTKAGNELGIFDMFGNVAEYCWNAYFEDIKTQKGGESRNESEQTFIAKGGDFEDNLEAKKISASWHGDDVRLSYKGVGIRVVRRLLALENQY